MTVIRTSEPARRLAGLEAAKASPDNDDMRNSTVGYLLIDHHLPSPPDN